MAEVSPHRALLITDLVRIARAVQPGSLIACHRICHMEIPDNPQGPEYEMSGLVETSIATR